MQKCVECKEREIHIKKVSLCARCYQRAIKREYRHRHRRPPGCYPTEIEFIQKYFRHQNWAFHPASFRINGTLYQPDFYDAERNVFIEVSGTRQAYHKGKNKYAAFRKAFPGLVLEIRFPNGQLLDETNERITWPAVPDSEQ